MEEKKLSEVNTWPGWKCVRLIGAGAFGKVYEIRREDYSIDKAALKVISIPRQDTEIADALSEGMDEQSMTEYFRSVVEDISGEFALMTQLKGYTNIVSYEDHMVLERKDRFGWDILIRMELLTSLRDYVTKKGMSERKVVKLGCDICKALEICHSKNILHRDIKVDNIFVNDFGDYKLGDFGVARVMERSVSNLSVKGTYSYMAPEVFRGMEYDYSADIYSLAMVLFRFLNNNRLPFVPLESYTVKDRSDAETRRLKGETVPEPLKGSFQLKKVIRKALSFEPQDRYQTASEFYKALEDCVEYCEDNPGEGTVGTEEGTFVIIDDEKSRKSSQSVVPEPDSGPEPEPKPEPAGQQDLGISKHLILALSGIALVFVIIALVWKMSADRSIIPEPATTETLAGGTETAGDETTGIKYVYYADGKYYVNEYDERGRITAFTSYSDAGEFRYCYKSAYNEADHTIFDMLYEKDGSKSTERTEYKCDDRWKRLSGTHFGPDNEPEYTLEFEYDKQGVLLRKIKRGMKGTIQLIYDYDADGNEIKRTYYYKGNLDRRYVYELDGRGYLESEKKYNSENDLVSSFTNEIDENGRRTKISWYNESGVLQSTIEYHPNLQECEKAVVTYYKEDGTIEKQEELTDLSE